MLYEKSGILCNLIIMEWKVSLDGIQSKEHIKSGGKVE